MQNTKERIAQIDEQLKRGVSFEKALELYDEKRELKESIGEQPRPSCSGEACEMCSG